MEDTEIIDLYWQRDQRAIDETHGKYGGFLAGIAWNILRSHSDAEECVNDTYLRTWNAIPPARPSAFRAWLGRIVRNLSLDRWKQSRTAKRGGDGMEVLLGELDDCVPEPHGTEKTMEDQEIASLISAFLRTQSEDARSMFILRYFYCDSIEEISSRFGCGESRVKTTLLRTRRKLREHLIKEGYCEA